MTTLEDQYQQQLAHEATIRPASGGDWPRLQRVLIHKRIEELLELAEAVARTVDGDAGEIHACRQRLSLPPHELNPAPLITGDDLRQIGMKPGPRFRRILEVVRDAQLNGEIQTRQQALELAEQTARQDTR